MEKTIKEVVDAIQNREYVLPAIQRNFVWDPEDIECLFDSILRGYPFGIFLFWKMNDTLRTNYRFYEFCERYKQGMEQTPLNCPLAGGCQYGILDGQQRLTSMCLALKGSYTYAKKKSSQIKERKFYLNLLKNHDVTDFIFEFCFLADDEVKNDDTHYWYLANNILTDSNWTSIASANRVYSLLKKNVENDETLYQALEKQELEIIEKLATLYTSICDKKLVHITDIDTQDENEVLDIFVRLNNQGKPLSRTDFIFSKIVAVWNNAREEIERLQYDGLVAKFKIFNKDMIMRICLAIAKQATVSKLTVSSLDIKTVTKIKDDWEQIKQAIIQTAELLNRLGYDSEKIYSTNAIIPIVCFIYNGGKWKSSHALTSDFEDIRKYLSIIRIKQIFSGQTISKLNNILSIIQKNTSSPFKALLATEMFNITKSDIENALTAAKGKEAFPILSLLYDKKYDECNFAQDHMHPISIFSKTQIYKNNGVSTKKMEEWKKMADTLPNLQILTYSENFNKSDTMLNTWVENTYTTPKKRKDYLETAFLPKDAPLDFADFEQFYKIRKKNLQQKLIDILCISVQKSKKTSTR